MLLDVQYSHILTVFTHTDSTSTYRQYSLYGLDGDLALLQVARAGVLLDVECGQPKRHVELELRSEATLDHVVTALQRETCVKKRLNFKHKFLSKGP